MNRRRVSAVVVVLAILGASCGSSANPDAADGDTASATSVATTAAPTTQPSAPTTTLPPATTIAEPDETEPVTVAGFRDQVIAWMSGEGEASQADYERIFADDFRSAVTLDELNSIWSQTIPIGPWRLAQTLGEDSSGGGFVLAGSVPEPQFLLSVGMVDGQVGEANLQPWTAPPASFDEAVAAVEGLGRTSYLIAETTSGSCVPVVDGGADEIIPLGSAFKLVVLGAVVDAVADGTIAWADPVDIRDELDSYPSGTTQDVPAGTILTVRELAELMISISDNTATDHLINLVGRDQVEAAQSAYGITQPELNQPFLTTRELFQIKLNTELRTQYLAADEAARRLLLEEISTQPLAPLEDVIADWVGPIELDTLEWFATSTDVCRVLVALNDNPEAAAILQINPGIQDDAGRWATIGFKGGSEPGLLVTAWIVTDADGRSFTVTGAAVSEGLIDELSAAIAFAGLRDQFVAP